ncbi:MAG: hypothetical protein AB7S26_15920 [Sandaracinaceae bacterium]
MQHQRTLRETLGWLAAVAALALAGCVATPVPDPPDIEPPNLANIVVNGPVGVPGMGSVNLDASADAVEPGATLWALGGFAIGPARTAPANDLGGFSTSVPVDDGRPWVRLQARDGERRSIPLDVDVDVREGPPTLLPLSSCVEIDSEARFDTDDVAVSIVNRCGATLTLARLDLRDGEPIELDPDLPRDIPDLGSDAILLRATGPDAFEGFVRVSLTGAVTEVRGVTVYRR